MKRFTLAGTVTALLAISLAFAACGGDDDDGGSSGDSSSNIRTNNGLEVANLVAALNGTGTNAGFFAPGAAPAAAEDGDAAISDERSAAQSAGNDAAVGYAPAFQTAGGVGVSAYGYGSATATADSALIDFYFYSYDDTCCIEPQPVPEPGTVPPDAPSDSDAGSGAGSDGSVGSGEAEDKPIQAGEVTPITEADLQAVIDALNAAGASDVEFIGQSYYDAYSSNATVRATVNNIDSVDAVVQAGTDASANLRAGITASGNNVSYTLQDCEALEIAAMTAAVEDARSQAETLAGVLGVTIGGVIGAADSSYSPYGSAPCSSSYYGPIPLDSRSATGAEGAAAPGEVQVFSSVSVTYAIN